MNARRLFWPLGAAVTRSRNPDISDNAVLRNVILLLGSICRIPDEGASEMLLLDILAVPSWLSHIDSLTPIW